MDIVERLREFESVKDYWGDWEIAKEAADEIERLREEVKELEEIMEENKCAVGYLITKRVLKQHGTWLAEEAMEATREILGDNNV